MNNLQEEKVNVKCGSYGCEFKVQKKSLMADGPVRVGLGVKGTGALKGESTATVSFDVVPLGDFDLCPKCCIECLRMMVKFVEKDEEKLMDGGFYIQMKEIDE